MEACFHHRTDDKQIAFLIPWWKQKQNWDIKSECTETVRIVRYKHGTYVFSQISVIKIIYVIVYVSITCLPDSNLHAVGSCLDVKRSVLSMSLTK